MAYAFQSSSSIQWTGRRRPSGSATFTTMTSGARAPVVKSAGTAASVCVMLAWRRRSSARSQPALRVGHPRELGWAATFLAPPYGRFISGHTLVVDGANWQRRSLTNPEVVPVREQMGRGPFGS